MKKSVKIISLTATALILSLCGIFFEKFSATPTPVSAEAKAIKVHSFSKEKAMELESLCINGAYPNTLKAAYQEKGFKDTTYIESSESNSYKSGIALCIGQRTAEKETEILVVFRASVGAEWYSNFHIGNGKTHAGFACAAEFSQEAIDKYMQSHGITPENTAITLTGHSRGGAVANLVAKNFIDRDCFLDLDAYTFASPNTTRDEDAENPKYINIYNIQNPEDFVCYLPLESWGYTKYGTILTLPEKEDSPEVYKTMEKRFMSLTGYPHVGYENGHSEIEEFLNHATLLSPTTEALYENYINTPLGDITLYGYLEKVASLISGENPIGGGFFILSSRQCESLRPLTDFLLKGMSFETLEDSFDMSRSAINSGHTFETYLAWLSVLDESYFSCDG